MSERRLAIEEVEVTTFGGLSDCRLALPSEGLVAVYGPNESGKSTLTELMSWLLCGPHGTASGAQRFGDYQATIGGIMTGTLGAEPFRAVGNFKVSQRGAPNSDGLTISHQGQLDLDQWLALLGGFDHTVLGGIYRWWGEDLHDGDAVAVRLEQAARGAHAGAGNAVTALAGLEARSSALLGPARNAGPETMRGLVLALRTNRQRLRAAQDNVKSFDRCAAQIQEAERRRDELRSQHSAAQQQRLRVDKVVDARVRQDDLAGALETLDAMVEPAAEWVEAATRLTELSGLVETLHDLDDQCGNAAGRLQAHLQANHLDADVIGTVSVTTATVAVAGRVAGRLTSEQAELHDAELLVEEAERRLNDAAAAARSSCELAGTTVGDVPERLADAAVQAGLTAALQRWSEAWAAADRVRADVTRRVTENDLAASRQGAARSAWEGLGLGVTAEQWMGRGATAQPTGGGARPQLWWAVPVAVSAVTFLAFAVGVWPVGVGAGLAAALAWWLAARQGSEAGTGPVPEALDHVRALAEEVFAAQEQLRTAAAELERARGLLDEADATSVELGARVAERWSDLGRSAPGDPQQGSEALAGLVEAATALLRESAEQRATDASHAAAARRRATVEASREELARLLESCGLSRDIEPAAVTSLLDAHQVAGELHAESRRLEDERVGRIAAMNELLAPIAEQTAGWSRQRIVERLREVATAQTSWLEATASVADARSLLDAVLGDDPAVRSLMDQALSDDELAARSRTIEDDLNALDAELARVSEDIGRMRDELAELERADEVGRVRLDVGTDIEASELLAREMASTALARVLLEEVSDRYVRENQPVIVQRAQDLACRVTDQWTGLAVLPDSSGSPVLCVRHQSGRDVPASRLSTGARALLYLAFRIALADHDADRRQVRLPLLCDDPLVHFDDDRAAAVVPLLTEAAAAGHQVLVFTCHERTADAIEAAGGALVQLNAV